jgi:hypothetical protein
MRQESTAEEALSLQARFEETLRRCGTLVTLHPSPARFANGALKRTVFALIEPPNANDIGHLKVEGDRNALSPAPLIFTFGGSSGVLENDRVEMDADIYVLLNALPQSFKGQKMGVRCVGIRRESPAADAQQPITEDAIWEEEAR